MGEAYPVQDTKLDRKVALKILSTDLAADEDHLRRSCIKQSLLQR
jgi:hypothetical protein